MHYKIGKKKTKTNIGFKMLKETNTGLKKKKKEKEKGKRWES